MVTPVWNHVTQMIHQDSNKLMKISQNMNSRNADEIVILSDRQSDTRVSSHEKMLVDKKTNLI